MGSTVPEPKSNDPGRKPRGTLRTPPAHYLDFCIPGLKMASFNPQIQLGFLYLGCAGPCAEPAHENQKSARGDVQFGDLHFGAAQSDVKFGYLHVGAAQSDAHFQYLHVMVAQSNVHFGYLHFGAAPGPAHLHFRVARNQNNTTN